MFKYRTTPWRLYPEDSTVWPPLHIPNIVIVVTVTNISNFLDLSVNSELLAFDSKNKQKPVKTKKPSPLNKTN